MTSSAPGHTTAGIHHITAICDDAQRNLDFYGGVLGLRLVKVTVNFDMPESYHLYYADGAGSPGTVMTFFAWPGARRGHVGAGQVAATAFAIPKASLTYWRARLAEHDVAIADAGERFGDQVLAFSDSDGMPLEIITHPAAGSADAVPTWAGMPVHVDHMIRAFHAPTLQVGSAGPSAQLLREHFGFRALGREAGRERFAVGDGVGQQVDLVTGPADYGVVAVGSVHHIAWRARDDADELAWQAELTAQGYGVTPVQDRNYFRSIYFREPSGILYEIATDPPGFTADEPLATLGQTLKLPAWLEKDRPALEKALTPLRRP